MKRIAITTGDPDGVGPEITAKALARIGPQRDALFYVFRDGKTAEKEFKKLDRCFTRLRFSSLKQALEQKSFPPKALIEVIGIDQGRKRETAADWVEDVAKACFERQLDAMVTGPLSKTLIQKSGRKEIGHTEILQKVTKTKRVFQSYLGQKFNVVLITAHLPIKDVSASLTGPLVDEVIRQADALREIMPPKLSRKPLALVGLNPHAGEEGLLGREEISILKKALQKARQRGVRIEGPLVPDAAFAQERWGRYSSYICPYHDQGLIPFKMIHGRSSGIQLSLGLPFVRTSVDHGTAKDIAGKNLADEGSMFDAIEWALQLSRRKV